MSLIEAHLDTGSAGEAQEAASTAGSVTASAATQQHEDPVQASNKRTGARM